MTSRYAVNYQLRSHKRDHFIEFIKTLLMNPFVLHSSDRTKKPNLDRYLEVLEHIEALIAEHIEHQSKGTPSYSRLYGFVPSLGCFFTPLPLMDAFRFQNERHRIASRRFVPPSFNDIRRLLNSAQIQAVANDLRLITFDGDVTLYEDGGSLVASSTIVKMLIRLLECGLYVAVVTAAGYTVCEDVA
jgi:IMP and pyridine-specific 5'-nucleotidase